MIYEKSVTDILAYLYRNTWRIGGTHCQKLYWGSKLDAEVWPGKIVWEDSAWPKVHGKARRWYKVNASS